MTRQTEKPDRPSEEAAHQVEVTGWACKHCNRFYGVNENAARYCCATSMPCECGARREKHYTMCEECREKNRDKRFSERPAVDWDGETPLYSDAADKYFFRPDDLSDWMADGISECGWPDHFADAADCIQRLRLLICKENRPRHFDANEYWCDDLGEDQELPDAREIENTVNQWIEKQRPLSWSPGENKPTPESLAKFVEIPLQHTTNNC